MKKDIKQLWVEALRSNNYQQSYETLRYRTMEGDTIGHCALGVLCSLYEKQTNDQLGENNWASGILPDAVVEWADLPSADPYLTMEYRWEDDFGNEEKHQEHMTISAWNDEQSKPFSELAEAIEQQL